MAKIQPVFAKVLKRFGNMSEVARALDLGSPQVVSHWRRRMGYIPAAHAIAVQVATAGEITALEVLREATTMETRRKVARAAAKEARQVDPVESVPAS